MNITRDVITDLWPLYTEGAASVDTRALVDEFLRSDPQWAKTLEHAAQAGGPLPAPAIRPDQEAQQLNRIKKRFRVMRWMLLLAMVFTVQAFGRIVSDTSWDVSPKNFIAVASVAGIFWIGFAIAAFRARKAGP
jgi:hypothetical protein